MKCYVFFCTRYSEQILQHVEPLNNYCYRYVMLGMSLTVSVITYLVCEGDDYMSLVCLYRYVSVGNG